MSRELKSIKVCLENVGYYPGHLSSEDVDSIVREWAMEDMMAGVKPQYTIVKNPNGGWDTKRI